jgi:hypothetical protein
MSVTAITAVYHRVRRNRMERPAEGGGWRVEGGEAGSLRSCIVLFA